MKFGATYTATIQGQTQTWTVSFPTTMEFDVQRATFASANTGKFVFKNLSAAMRKDIYYDRFYPSNRKMSVQAGYVGSFPLPLIFQGYIRMAFPERRGVDWITSIDAWDGGFAIYNAKVQPGTSVKQKYSMKSAVEALVANMQPYGVTLGKVSDIVLQDTGNGRNFNGMAWEELRDLVPGAGEMFIDNAVLNVLNPQDYLPTPVVPVISAQTGLLGTPRKQGNLTTARMIFEPTFVVAQAVALTCSESWLNSPLLKLVGLHHYGKISGVENGERITETSLFTGYPATPLKQVGTAEAAVSAG